MALEKWEIELRKQLDKKVNSPKQAQTWEDKIVADVGATPIVYKSNNTAFMMIAFIVLGFAILFALYEKSDKFQSWTGSDDISSKTEIVMLKSDVEKLNEKMKRSTERINLLGDRLNLMGILFNENFTVLKNNHDRSNLMYFNRDWTISSMPKYIKLTDEDREYLKKYIKAQ